MFVYEYTRELGDEIHSNPDTYNIGHDGEPENLSLRIEALFPGKRFVVRCQDIVCRVEFSEALTEPEISDLSTAIAEHKAVVDWPPAE